MQALGDELDFARRELQIRLLPLDYAPFDRNDEFRARLLGLGVRFRLRFFIEDNLKDAGAVADVEKEEIAEVAAAMDPAHDDDVAAVVGRAQLAAIMRALQLPQEVQHVACPLPCRPKCGEGSQPGNPC